MKEQKVTNSLNLICFFNKNHHYAKKRNKKINRNRTKKTQRIIVFRQRKHNVSNSPIPEIILLWKYKIEGLEIIDKWNNSHNEHFSNDTKLHRSSFNLYFFVWHDFYMRKYNKLWHLAIDNINICKFPNGLIDGAAILHYQWFPQ